MIDVIICAYNSHKTIEKTLMSLAIQRLCKFLDVLIINDGSDNDYSIYIERYKKWFKSLREITLKENHGVGYCKQLGLENTNNKYIYFLDSDDTMYSCFAFNELIKPFLEKSDTNIVQGNIEMEYSPSFRNSLDENYICYLGENSSSYFLHAKLYKRQFIENNNIKFSDVRFGEDTAFNFACLTISNPENIVNISTLTMSFNYSENSITRSKNSFIFTDICSTLYYLYISTKESFECVCKALDYKVNPKILKRYVFRFYEIVNRLEYCYKNEDELLFGKMICARFTYDIINEINQYSNYPVLLNNKHLDECRPNLFNDKEPLNIDINKYKEECLSLYSDEKFNELKEKFLQKNN